jgi:hypothetical protein
MRSTLKVLLLFSVVSCAALAADITLSAGLNVAPGDSVPLSVFLTDAAPPGGITVTLASSDKSKLTVTPENVYIQGGSTAPLGLPRVSGVSFGSAAVTASAYGLTGSSQIVKVSAALSGPTTQTIQKGSTLNVMPALALPSPNAVTLSVRSDNPAIASVLATATIPAGGTTAVVPITGLDVGTTVVHVSALPNISEFAVTVNVLSSGAITLPSVSLQLGQSLPFPIALGAPSGPAGVVVTLTSSNPAIVKIAPTSVYIPAGQTMPATQPEVLGENIGAATITASAPDYVTTSQVTPVTATITIAPKSANIPVGGTQLISLILSSSAPSIGVPITPDRAADGFVEGLTVQLSSSDPRIASVQPTVQFYPDGSSITTVLVVVVGQASGIAVIHASAPPFIADSTTTIIVGNPGPIPTSITVSGGTPQTAQVNTPFGLPLSAIVRDSNSNPVSGVTVTFASSGSGAGATFAGGVNTATTDASGLARSQTLTANGTAGTYTVTASAAGVATPAAFTLTNLAASSGTISLPGNVTVGPNQTLPFPVSLTVPAPANGVTVSLNSNDASKVAITPASVFIAAGATTPAVQPMIIGVTFGSASIGASATGYTSASQLVQVAAALSFSPPSLAINGPGSQNLLLSLSAPAPAAGLNVTLSSSNPAVASVAGSVNIAANATSVVVPVSGANSGSATITASTAVPNVSGATAAVTVTGTASSNISIGAGVKVAPGESAVLPVFLTSAARPGGVTVGLASSDNSKLTVSPANIYIPEGATAPFSQPQVTGVNLGTVAVSASAYGLTGTTQTVQVIGKMSGPASQTVQGGSTLNVIFILSGPTPTPITLTVRSDNPAVAKVPSTVTIPANSSMAVVPVEGVAVGSTIIHASALPDIAESVVTITVQTPGTITLSGGSAVPLGQAETMTVVLGTPAPLGGLVVTLASSDPTLASISPNSVFIPAGATTSATQPVVTAKNVGTATITASAPNYLTASQAVTVTATITMSPSTLVIPSGGTRLLALVLSAAAPSPDSPITPDRGAGGFVNGLTVQLSSSDPGVATLQPSTQFYPDGSSITTVVVVVTGVAPGTAIIHAGAPPSIPDVTATVIVQ